MGDVVLDERDRFHSFFRRIMFTTTILTFCIVFDDALFFLCDPLCVLFWEKRFAARVFELHPSSHGCKEMYGI